MSFQAMTWAASRRWGGPSARSVIYAITNCASPDKWFCFAKQETLAEESEQSVDSVGRRISEFVAAGFIRRIKLKRYGRRCEDFLILQPSPYFEAPLSEIEPFLPRGCDLMQEEMADFGSPQDDARPAILDGDAAANSGSVEAQETPAPQGEGKIDAAANCGSAEGSKNGATLPQPADDATALVREHEPVFEPEDSPQSPPQGETARGFSKEGSAREGPGSVQPSLALQLLDEFRRTYPVPTNRPDKLIEAWQRLGEVDMRACIRGAAGARHYRDSNSRRPPPLVDPAKFVANPLLWAEYARHAPAERPAPPPLVFVAGGSDAWAAHGVWAMIWGAAPRRPIEVPGKGLGGMFASEYPPIGRGLSRIIEHWLIIEEGSREWSAWRERLHTAADRWIEPEMISTGKSTRKRMPSGEEVDFPVKVRGRRFPCQWPPRKDGTISVGVGETTDDRKVSLTGWEI